MLLKLILCNRKRINLGISLNKELKTDIAILAAELSQLQVRIKIESEHDINIIMDYSIGIKKYTLLT